MTAIATPPLTFIFPRELSYLSRVAAPHRIAPFFLREEMLARSHAKVFSLSDFFLNGAQCLFLNGLPVCGGTDHGHAIL